MAFGTREFEVSQFEYRANEKPIPEYFPEIQIHCRLKSGILEPGRCVISLLKIRNFPRYVIV